MSTLTNVVVFEGTAYLPDAKRYRATQIINQADEVDRIKPLGDYSGRTDEIILALISDYCEYITAGTLSNGTAMGSITFSGDKTLRRILHEFAESDGFTWYLKPQGQLFYDDGTNDTGVDISSDDSGSVIPINVDAFYQNPGINAVIVRGAYVEGVQVISDKQSNAEDVLLNGETLIYITDSTTDTKALANSKALNILTREVSDPLTARFEWRNTTKGLPQKGQQITLKFISNDVNIAEAQYILDKINYDGKFDLMAIECSSGLVFRRGSEEERLPQENSQQIAQVADTVDTINSDYLDSGAIDNTDWNGSNWTSETKAVAQKSLQDLIKDEDDMASDSDIHLATQQSIKKFVEDSIKDSISPFPRNCTIDGITGFAKNLVTTYGASWYVIHSDNAADILFKVICPKTSSSLKITIIHGSNVAPVTDTGNIYVGKSTPGSEPLTTNSEIDGDPMNLINTEIRDTEIYKTSSAAFAATKGDIIQGYWHKNGNHGANFLYIYQIILEE